MNRALVYGCLAGALLLSAGATQADQKSKDAGRAAGHKAGSIGHGVSKIYHEAAKGTHKVIAKNTRNKHKSRYHMKKAAAHKRDSHVQSNLSRKEKDRASRAAKKL